MSNSTRNIIAVGLLTIGVGVMGVMASKDGSPNEMKFAILAFAGCVVSGVGAMRK